MEHVNLIPKSDREARAVRRRVGRWAGGLMCVMPLVVAAVSVERYQEGCVERAVAENEQLAAATDVSRVVLGDLRAAVSRADARRARAHQMRDKRRWSALIFQVVATMPPGIWLTSLSSDPATPGGSRGVARNRPMREAEGGYAKFEVDAARGLIIKGLCADPASPLRFVTALRETGMFKTISHEHLRRSGGEVAQTFQFEIRCEW